MNTTMKKTDAEKQLIKFRNQMHNLLIKYPEIQIASDIRGDVTAWIFSKQEQSIKEIYLPTSGKQEMIQSADEYVANMRCRIGNK